MDQMKTDQWSSKMGFIFASAGAAIGLGQYGNSLT